MSDVLIICDIDGVLADCEHRLKYLHGKDYDAFYSIKMADDTVIKEGLSLLKALRNEASNSSTICYATGRPERTRNLTLNWLEANYIPQAYSYYLWMRKDDDYRPSPELKVEQVQQILKDRDVINNNNFVGALEEIATTVVSILTGKKKQLPTIYFIDDDPENVKAVCEAFPKITGITFGTGRFK